MEAKEEASERDRFDAYLEYKRLGWRIDSLIDELDKFNTRLRSATARISRLKSQVDGAEEDEELPGVEEEELPPQVDPLARERLIERILFPETL